MDILLIELQSEDVVTRKNAVARINRLSRGRWTVKNKEFLTDDAVLSIVIHAIEQEIDITILLNTVGSISQRYEYYDLRILEALIPLYEHVSISIKVAACTWTIQFNDPKTWNAICQIFGVKTTKITNRLLGLMIARHAKNVPQNFIVKLSSLIQNAFVQEKNLDAKDALLLALGKVGNDATIAFINKQVLKKGMDRLLKERATHILEEIAERSAK
ncbi:unnamed protein product [Commensalibacter communis]|uniref:Uncharacterized protein n=1 Tax=Commensalibacter communis TaxID=2972786 RepID=A0A9W4XGR6_9PROT|nr:hypothetical protein [Commensalibacter communis]CAI3922501.1 unnamed protein product [Commensalibacter communis]CAI3923804.1 unnamed protein product [Commensalibacter communis]CAI3938615.1 unnamed protein product [Commensalibacter communis]CAI3939190.1 unnamed protein product [Commensalibacter communis]